MRCYRGGRAAVFTLTVTTLLALGGLHAGAEPGDGDGDGDPDGDEGGKDLAIPAPDANRQLLDAGVQPATAGEPREPIGVPAGTLAVTPLDDFRYTPQRTEGIARDICYGRMRPGTARTFYELQRRFGGTAGTLYACRERWNAAEEPDCNGTLVSPATNPNFFSTCWSNHAQGRALDLMSTRQRGNAVVNWLLAPDRRGNYSAMARRLGVQQILWRDHCWNTDDDRGVLRVRGMRKCGIGHFDHVHIDLTLAGAMGRTSYWGGRPKIWPKMDGTWWWDRNGGTRSLRSWFNYRQTERRTGGWRPRFDAAIAGDWDRDRVEDDIVLWNRDTGGWAVKRGGARRGGSGRWSTRWDALVAGNWDGDRRADDLFLWDRTSGAWAVKTWTARGFRSRADGVWPAGFDEIRVGDFDEDNRLDDMFVWDRQTGRVLVMSWRRYAPTRQWVATVSRAYTQFVVGDWDSDGERNDMLIRNRSTGAWKVLSWDGFRPTERRSGTWRPRFKQIVAADLDAEGRVDDMLVRSPRTGQLNVIEWRYYRWHVRNRSASGGRWDHIIAVHRG